MASRNKLEPFCGSGTTMLAAVKAGRNSTGVEIDHLCCKQAPCGKKKPVRRKTGRRRTGQATASASRDE